MRRCAFLTMASLDGYVSDDALAVAALEEAGWSVDFVDWRRRIDWSEFDLVVVRSTWDYHYRLDEYLEALERIAAATRLENRLDTLRWNARKTYLRDLQRGGVEVIPTWFGERLDGDTLDSLFERLETDELVIKPTVGANSIDTHRISAKNSDRIRFPGSRPEGSSTEPRAAAVAAFRDRPVMAQPFMRGIVEEGEYSLVFFAGEFSHAILKTPKDRDFRVQEEHGGTIRAVAPEPGLLAAGRAVVEWLDRTPLYARIDLVRTAPREFQAMEVELIEPSLYLRTDAAAPARFAAVIAAAGSTARGRGFDG